jgi:hypothetical protein
MADKIGLNTAPAAARGVQLAGPLNEGLPPGRGAADQPPDQSQFASANRLASAPVLLAAAGAGDHVPSGQDVALFGAMDDLPRPA